MEKKDNLKIYALYLPAFHRIKENDEWWGEGFTEWMNVKKAKPLYKGHVQPMIPIDEKYYDLTDVKSLREQARLANEYKVDGFVAYHYWFNGKKLLEKPFEIVRDNNDIDMNYCFCWANEPWARTWDGKHNDILMPQEYGDKADWINHIEYLYTFFKDDRYIKFDERPVFYVYSPSKIPEFDKMIEAWNDFLNNKNMKPIYLVEFISTKNPKPISFYSSAVMEFEPMYINRFGVSAWIKFKRLLCKKLKIIDFGDYDYLWKKILNNNREYGDKEIFKGCFSGWDNSPRKGSNSMIVKNCNDVTFGKNLEKLVNKKRKNSNRNVIVVNAWNEWGEGAILEPTKQFKYKYLEKIKQIKELKKEQQ